MSVRGLNEVAVQRDLGEAQRVADQPQKADGAEQTKSQGYLDLLVTAIPTEPLALYTFVIAAIVATIGDGGDRRLTMRWIIFAVTTGFIVLWMLAAYVRKSKEDTKDDRRLPVPEILSAVVAFGAWGLAMPESPLIAELSGSDRTVWTVIIIAAGAASLGLLTGTLKKPSKMAKINSAEKEGDSAAATQPTEEGPSGLLAALGAATVAATDAFHKRRATGR
jgi:hypothetical protein